MRRLARALAVTLALATLALVMGCGSTGPGTSPGSSENAAGKPPALTYTFTSLTPAGGSASAFAMADDETVFGSRGGVPCVWPAPARATNVGLLDTGGMGSGAVRSCNAAGTVAVGSVGGQPCQWSRAGSAWGPCKLLDQTGVHDLEVRPFVNSRGQIVSGFWFWASADTPPVKLPVESAHAISEDGLIAASRDNRPVVCVPDDPISPTSWTVQELAVPGADPNAVLVGHAYGINNCGQVVGLGAPGGSHPFLWTTTDSGWTATDLGLPKTGIWGQAMAINDQGLVVAFVYSSSGRQGTDNAYVWRNGAWIDLKTASGAPYPLGFPYDISSNGVICGTCDIPKSANDAAYTLTPR